MTDIPTRKDKGKAMKPSAYATHCGGYPTDTPTPDLTAPPLDEVFDTHREVEKNPCGACQAIQDLSAKLEAAEAKADKFGNAWVSALLMLKTERVRAEAAEAERDAALTNLTALQSDEWLDKPDSLTSSIVADFGSAGFHDRYAQAIEMVSNRHSKGALVSLVGFLLAARQKGGEG